MLNFMRIITVGKNDAVHMGKAERGKSSQQEACRELPDGARQQRNADELTLELSV